MAAPQELIELVERFARNIEAYKSGAYNETQVRREFIDPLFKLLGWDMDNAQGYAEAYKDVVHEDAIKVERATKAPDYCFRVGGTRKFFLEAKKPQVNIKEDVNPAFQLRRYAWSAKLPLSVLTDFEEFAVYDCRLKPVKTDKASTGRVLYFKYTDYAAHWDEIAAILSREAVLKGSFDKYAESTKSKKGTAEVDAAFLREIESWRESLAKNLALRNPSLSQRELNFAVQRIIDRVIFLRICEDRGMEMYGRLMALQNGSDVYKRLCHLFQEADNRYNSGLFHFRSSRERPTPPDDLTLKLSVDDKVLKDIFKNLYFPESPYEFSVLPSDILGQVYEQFLGKVIRLTSGHRAMVEDKPEVKKAGGVFYTPTYIVDYIVKETVGKLLDGKKPGPKGSASKIRVLDPACGSGSFLIGAYQYLLDWHRESYMTEDPQKHKKELFQAQGGEWRLTTAEKKRILLNNIYGVDIDAQAVETTKLSLLLKVLEGESGETITKQWKLLHERALPDLGNNIKCGNSLIGPDFYNGKQLNFFDDDERHRVNVFDWNAEFKEIMKAGGFDAVIGNPPYGAFFSNDEKSFIKDKFKSYKYRYDSYIYFIEKSFFLANKTGCISFITPELWLRLENCVLLRKFIAENIEFEKIRVFGENVFEKAVVNTIVFTFRLGRPIENLTIEMKDENWDIPSESWKTNELFSIDYRLRHETVSIFAKIDKQSLPLHNFGEVIQGITPYDKYRGQDAKLIKSRGYHFDYKKDETCGRWLSGSDIKRYKIQWSGEWLSYGSWLAASREERFFNGLRLLFREVPGEKKRIQCFLEKETFFHGHSITPFKPIKKLSISLKYLLGLSNSRLLSWYGSLKLPNFGKDIFPKLNPKDIKLLPIRTIDFSNPTDKSRHDRMVSLVDRMLDLNRELAKAKTAHDQTVLKRQMDATDGEIDRLVYELYGLTEEEVKIIEGM